MTQAKTARGSAKKRAPGRMPANRAATKAGAAKGAPRAGAATKESRQDLEAKPIRNLRFHTKKLIASQFSEIMESMAERSKEGSLAHAKFLFEIGGVKEDLARGRRGKVEPSLADLLMDGVRARKAALDAGFEHPLEAGDESSLSLGKEEDVDEGAAD